MFEEKMIESPGGSPNIGGTHLFSMRISFRLWFLLAFSISLRLWPTSAFRTSGVTNTSEIRSKPGELSEPRS